MNDLSFKKEFIKMTFNLEVKSMYTFKGIGYYWMNEETVAKYPKIFATILSPFYLLFQVHILWNLGLAMCISYFEHGMCWTVAQIHKLET